ncbi:MAG: hypothetical protein QOK16_4228 [Solirubrobacteraceae bacterium]|nr:hypothetical protein [Solirubrobacteraceae bacterium]
MAIDVEHDSTLRARACARVARTRARVDNFAGAAANRELSDALEFAATEARLALDELVDAYMAGAPDLELSEAWEDVEDYLQRIAAAHEHHLDCAFARIERASPDWRRRPGLRIAAHDLALAAHQVLGDLDERIDLARRSVVEILDGARAARRHRRRTQHLYRPVACPAVRSGQRRRGSRLDRRRAYARGETTRHTVARTVMGDSAGDRRSPWRGD